jgi:adenine/guanine phosphoribosyltransferase-like PRPP-binding protein
MHSTDSEFSYQERYRAMEKDIVTFIKKHKNLLRLAKTLTGRKTRYYGFTESVPLILEWCDRLPSDFDLVIGIPRKGLFIANIIALRFGLPLATPEQYLQYSRAYYGYHIPTKTVNYQKILIVEDNVKIGHQARELRNQIQALHPEIDVRIAAMYVHPEAKQFVDYHFKQSKNEVFAWDLPTIMNHTKTITDLDGILCEECPVPEEKPKVYGSWIRHAKPRLVPLYPLMAIVTGRSEKYRKATEEWLLKNGIEYKQLIMYPDVPKTQQRVIQFKAEQIKRLDPYWVWESNVTDALGIFKITRIPVLCFQNNRLYQ